jgi:two-component system, OmpR family, heavy metal sensor histidine kinase CusS
MSSTTPESDPRLPVPEFLRRPRSITGRLALLYVGATALLLLLAAGYLYWGLQTSLARSDRALILGKLQVLRLLLREPPDRSDVLASEIEHEAAANELLKYYLRVLDERGGVLLETGGMAGLLPVMDFPAPARLSAGEPAIGRRTQPSGRTYLLLAAEAAAGPAGTERRIVQIGHDVAHTESLLADYRRRLLAAVVLGVVLAGGAGVVVSRVGLRPLRDLALTAHRISASKLGERVSAKDWPEELRECAAAFDGMLDRLQESFGRLTEFSADIAHAMRNPVNNLRGETEVALTRARTPEEYRQILGSSLEEFERLSAMIEGLLFIARADDPATALVRTRFNVREQMDAVREFYEALAAEQQVIVTCEGDAPLTGDPMLVRRAISNLLGNAFKHTAGDGRGRVTLAARATAGGGAEITVTDNGCGIAAAHLSKVFERFYQVDQSRAEPAKGAGLGLTIVRSIMRLHGGEAVIESTVGRQTVVTLRFPPPCDGPPVVAPAVTPPARSRGEPGTTGRLREAIGRPAAS